jgi:hypothetical protein
MIAKQQEEDLISSKLMKEYIHERNKMHKQNVKPIFLVGALEKLKRIGEGMLRWSFFTLNMFMLAIAICQN